MASLYNKLVNSFLRWLSKEPPPSEIPPFDYKRLKYEIRPGDVLLIEGRSRVSNIIRTVTQSPWTHAALYIGRFQDIEDNILKKIVARHVEKSKNSHLIIEGILGKGNIVTSLSSYRHHHIRICRPVGLSPEDAQLAIGYAIRALGRPYSMRKLFDLARFLLPWSILPRRWGSSLFRTNSGEIESGICSSLIAETFAAVQFPILPFIQPEESGGKVIRRNPHLYTPKDFDYSPYFEIIKYPILSAQEQAPYYRRLPWSSEAIHNDEGIISDPTIQPKKFFEKFRRKKKKTSYSESSSEENSSDDKETK